MKVLDSFDDEYDSKRKKSTFAIISIISVVGIIFFMVLQIVEILNGIMPEDASSNSYIVSIGIGILFLISLFSIVISFLRRENHTWYQWLSLAFIGFLIALLLFVGTKS